VHLVCQIITNTDQFVSCERMFEDAVNVTGALVIRSGCVCKQDTTQEEEVLSPSI
jgi:hypothetical protein